MTSKLRPPGFFRKTDLIANLPRQGPFAPDEGMGLADGTAIPTPEGWTVMREVNAGQKVFDHRGCICTVVEVRPQGIVPGYRVRFDDRSSLVAGGRQEWITISDPIHLRARRNAPRRGVQRGPDVLPVRPRHPRGRRVSAGLRRGRPAAPVHRLYPGGLGPEPRGRRSVTESPRSQDPVHSKPRLAKRTNTVPNGAASGPLAANMAIVC